MDAEDVRSRDVETISIRKAEVTDAEEIYALMLKVYEGLVQKELFVCDDLEYIQHLLQKDGFGVVACLDGQIIGSFLCCFPGESEENLGRDIGLAKEEWERVVHMDSAVVDSAFRGLGLQGRMLREAEAILKSHEETRIAKQKKAYILLATVSPDNPGSYKTLEKNGYEILLTKEKYGGLLRRIYGKRA